jgi:5-methylcytosine-specific restriction protein B
LLNCNLNARIEDANAAIGPSYVMDTRIYQRDDGLERVWQYAIMLLLADLFYGQYDLEEQYGLTALRCAIGAPETTSDPVPAASEPSPADGEEP